VFDDEVYVLLRRFGDASAAYLAHLHDRLALDGYDTIANRRSAVAVNQAG